MVPKQGTLGKFLGTANGVASKPQQSKLTFGKPKSAGAPSENETVNGHDAKKQDDSKHVMVMEEDDDGDGDVKMKSTSEDVQSKSEQISHEGDAGVKKTDQAGSASPTATPRSPKRNYSEIRDVKEEDNDEDDEPIRKRSRKEKPSKSSSKKVKTEQSTKSHKESKSPDVFEAKVKDNNTANATSKEKKSSKKQTKPEKKSPVEVTANDDEYVEEEAGAVNEEDDAESDDEDAPEVAAKAREKVEATLKGSDKDPYPDWKPGESVPYAALCTTFSLIEMTTKRLIISAHCSLFLRQVLRLTPQDMLPTIQLMINKLAAEYAGIELGIGESLIMKAIGETTGRSLPVIKADQNEIGDLGLVAAKSRGSQPTMFKPKPLTIRAVRDGLMGIATTSGKGSQDLKISGIKKLLSAADASKAGKGIDITKDKGGASETKFIIRFLEGKLRLGLAEKTVLVAVAHAMVMHETAQKGDKVPNSDKLAQGESILKTVYSELPSWEVIVPAMLEHGIFNLRDNCKLQPGVPLKPMLAKPTKSITEVLDRFEGKDFTCEYKYDGERAQIHYVAEDSPQQYPSSLPSDKSAKGLSAIFSRNSEDLSKKYPDILAKLNTWINKDTKSFVLDCETVAWDMVEKKVLPFQQLMTRKRKDVKVEDVKVKVCVFAFDMLFYNGEAVVQKPLRERRALLHEAFTPVEGEFAFAQHGNTSNIDEIQVLLDESVKASCEGLMVKMLDSPASFYEPSKRSLNWLKVKKDYLAGIGDSLDLVVLGAYFGKGKRTSVYGAFLLACYDANTETFESVCNIGTGFSEAILEELHAKLSDAVIDNPKPFYAHSTVTKDQPDVWFEPRFVWEVKTADLTLSPRYRAGAEALGDAAGKGISLRFPRFVKEREDKVPEQAMGSRAVVEMYLKQESVGGSKGGTGVDDDFEY